VRESGACGGEKHLVPLLGILLHFLEYPTHSPVNPVLVYFQGAPNVLTTDGWINHKNWFAIKAPLSRSYPIQILVEKPDISSYRCIPILPEDILISTLKQNAAHIPLPWFAFSKRKHSDYSN
jgi:hypothetical protein